MLFRLVLLICLGQFYLISSSDSDSESHPDHERFRPRYGELRTSDLLRQQAISGATHQDDLVWLNNEQGYRAAIEHALDQSQVPLSCLRPEECELDEKSKIVSSGGEVSEFLVHQHLGIFYPYDPEFFDERTTVHDLDRFNYQLADNRAYLLSQLPKVATFVAPKKDLAQVVLGCEHRLCRGCAYAIQTLEGEGAKCPTCRAPIENANLVKKLPIGDACPVCLDQYQTTQRFGSALGAELRFSPIQNPEDK